MRVKPHHELNNLKQISIVKQIIFNEGDALKEPIVSKEENELRDSYQSIIVSESSFQFKFQNNRVNSSHFILNAYIENKFCEIIHQLSFPKNYLITLNWNYDICWCAHKLFNENPEPDLEMGYILLYEYVVQSHKPFKPPDQANSFLESIFHRSLITIFDHVKHVKKERVASRNKGICVTSVHSLEWLCNIFDIVYKKIKWNSVYITRILKLLNTLSLKNIKTQLVIGGHLRV